MTDFITPLAPQFRCEGCTIVLESGDTIQAVQAIVLLGVWRTEMRAPEYVFLGPPPPEVFPSASPGNCQPWESNRVPWGSIVAQNSAV